MIASESVACIEVASCPICHAIDRVHLFDGWDRLHGLPGSFPVVRCLNCKSSYLVRRPADLASYYPADSYAAYEGAGMNRHYSRAPGRGYGLRRRRELLRSLKPGGGTLLDVGCGTGDFLVVMRDRPDWRVEGLEPSSDASRYAREVRGLSVRQGMLPLSDLPGHYYDVIMMWHVLEHIPDLVAALEEVRRLLRIGGLLVVAIPAVDSLEANLFGQYWAGYDVPRHLVAFSRSSLRDFLIRSGYSVEERRGVVQGFASLRLSMNLWLRERGTVWRRWSRMATWISMLPLYLYMRWRGGHSSSVAVFVARPTRQ